MNDLFYCGVGARKTPEPILELMTSVAEELADNGFILRSGHAPGADIAFEKGSKGMNQIWLPWAGFNDAGSDGLPQTGHYVLKDNWVADKIAEQAHPAWNRCDATDRKLLTRNVYEVLGPGLGIMSRETMGKFVLCWTEDGKASGGTGQTIRIADLYKIPVFNLYHADALTKLGEFLQG